MTSLTCVGPLGDGHFWKVGYTAFDGSIAMGLAWGFNKNGVKISVEDAASVPAEFIVYFSENRHVQRRCRQVWQFDNVVNAVFVEDPTQADAAPASDVPSAHDEFVWL